MMIEVIALYSILIGIWIYNMQRPNFYHIRFFDHSPIITRHAKSEQQAILDLLSDSLFNMQQPHYKMQIWQEDSSEAVTYVATKQQQSYSLEKL